MSYHRTAADALVAQEKTEITLTNRAENCLERVVTISNSVTTLEDRLIAGPRGAVEKKDEPQPNSLPWVLRTAEDDLDVIIKRLDVLIRHI